MFEEKDNIGNDLLMRAILEQGQEEVPARVWDGVAAGLDRIHGRRRKVTLWWRSAVAAVSVAAAVAVVFLAPSQQDMLVPEAADENMIAVVENPVPQMQSPAEESVISASKTQNLTAYVPETRYVPTAANAHETVISCLNCVSLMPGLCFFITVALIVSTMAFAPCACFSAVPFVRTKKMIQS